MDYTDYHMIDADEVNKINDALENQAMPFIVAKIQDHLEKLEKEPLNIAVTGESGSGKSSFINAFRGLGDVGEGCTPTGVVETTLVAERYTHPKYPNVKLWDLPGIGTPTFQADKYLVEVKFERYDFFIIEAADRFKECHVQLASEILKMKKNFYFLRNKIDVNLAAEMRSKRVLFNEEKTLETIRQDCIKGLRLFLGLYDFSRLPMLKRHVLLLARRNIALKFHQKKKAALKADIWKLSLLSGAVATVPFPGLSFAVDADILLKEIQKYLTSFGLDDLSQKKLSEVSQVSLEDLKAEMKYAQNMPFSITGVIEQLISTSSLFVVAGTAEYIFSLIPVIGSAIAGGMSFCSTRYLLNKYLDELAIDAQNVLMKALPTSV